jgi:Tol biopolymer transport system component
MKKLRVFATVLIAIALAAVPAPRAQTRQENDKAAGDAVRNRSLPLVTNRALSFTTSEGTWISLDLSRDGRTLVFELLGDLYTLPITGGEATRITSGQAYDMQPAFSPDGTRIVFISDRNGSENVWMANADGSKPRAVTSTERENYMSPVWTPDGEYVIAAKGAQLWMYHEHGGSGVQMTGGAAPAPGTPAPPAPALTGPAFAPDSRYLWVNVRGATQTGFATRTAPALEDQQDPSSPHYDAHRDIRSSARMIGSYQVGQLDRVTGRVHVRTHEHEGAFRPVPSPDGRWLVYATRHDSRAALKLIDLLTGEDRWLRLDVQRDDSEGGGARDRDVYPASVFTPDSKAIVTSYGGKIWRVAVPSGHATEIPFTAKIDQQLGPLVRFDYPIDDSPLTLSQIRGARPSPDGRRLVFTALDRLWTADLPEGRGLRKESRPRRPRAGRPVAPAPARRPNLHPSPRLRRLHRRSATRGGSPRAPTSNTRPSGRPTDGTLRTSRGMTRWAATSTGCGRTDRARRSG